MPSLHRLQLAWREVVQNLWVRRTELDGMTPEEARIISTLAEHPEYRRFWEDPELVNDASGTDGVNPYLHVQVHAMVESQIALDHPREVRQTLDRLTHAGVPRHEAIHRIGEVMVRTMKPPAPGSSPFDHEGYATRLRNLSP
jgi:hypothetical protein